MKGYDDELKLKEHFKKQPDYVISDPEVKKTENGKPTDKKANLKGNLTIKKLS